MAGVGVAPPPNHPPTSLAGGSTRARHPGRSIARARCGGKRHPGCLSVPLPHKSPGSPPPTIPSKLSRSSSPCAMYDDARAKPTSPRALRRRRLSLARSIARARCGGGGSVRLHRPSRALRAPRVTRARAYVIAAHRARHRRFPSPPCTTGTRALQRRRRSLARARLHARGVAVAMVMAVAVGHAARDARDTHRASCIRMRVSSPRVARVITGSIPPARTRVRAAAAALA